MLPRVTEVLVTGIDVAIEVTFGFDGWVVVEAAADDWDCCATTKGVRSRTRRRHRGAMSCGMRERYKAKTWANSEAQPVGGRADCLACSGSIRRRYGYKYRHKRGQLGTNMLKLRQGDT